MNPTYQEDSHQEDSEGESQKDGKRGKQGESSAEKM